MTSHPHLPPPPGAILLFEGDSMTGFRRGPTLDTWAWQRMTGAAVGYPEKVGDWLFCHRPDLRLDPRMGAVAGSTMTDVLSRWERTAQVKPAWTIMTIGANDARKGVTPAQIADQMADFTRRLDALCGGRVLYLGGNLPCPGNSEAAKTARLQAQPHEAAVAAVVQAAGGLVVPVGPRLVQRATALAALWEGHTLFHDGTHFNAVGNEVMAGIVLEALGVMTRPGAPEGFC